VTVSAGRPAQPLTLAERLLLLSFRLDTGKQKARADGFLWEYYAPLRNHESQMRFLGTVDELADRGRPSFSERDRSTDGGIATVLVALAHTNSGSAT
jgi:hypothetical protein